MSSFEAKSFFSNSFTFMHLQSLPRIHFLLVASRSLEDDLPRSPKRGTSSPNYDKFHDLSARNDSHSQPENNLSELEGQVKLGKTIPIFLHLDNTHDLL